MIRARHLILLLAALAASSCGKKEAEGTAPSATGNKSARSENRTERGEGDDGDAVRILKRSFEDALVTPDAASREKALEQVAWDGIDVDADLARRAFEKLPTDSPARQRLAAHFAMRLAESNPDEAIGWAKTLAESERAEALGRVAVVISNKEPERAARLIAEEIPAGTPRDRAVVQVLQRWAQAEPAAAAGWTGELPVGAARSAGLKVTLGAWLEKDAPATAAWIEARGDDTLRTECLVAVADSLRRASPALRTQGVAAFGNVEIRGKLENLLAQPPP